MNLARFFDKDLIAVGLRAGTKTEAVEHLADLFCKKHPDKNKDQILKAVMEMNVKKMVYVSCNPSTLARDLADMSDKYEVIEIQPVDMFPHTYHIESVAKLRLKRI